MKSTIRKPPCARYSVKLRAKLINCVGAPAAALLLTLNATAATFTVTTVADSGPGSLRQAILDANVNPGPDTIVFALGDVGTPQTIQPTTALPTIADPVTIDGWSQGGAGFTGPPLIELNGALAGPQAAGLTLTGGSSVVRGLVVNGFAIGGSAGGIRLRTSGDNWIYGNYIGVNFAGDTRVANTRGIWIDNGSSNNRIGTNADGVNDTAERNVISANVEQNIWIYQPATTGNKIMGNYIGLNAAGTAAVGTNNQTVAAAGILVQEASYTVIGTDGDGQGDALEGNVISGSILNINLTGTSNLNESHHNRISGNRIGTNADGTASVGIQAEGVRVYVAYDNLIGTDGDGISDELEGNLISGNIDFGVMLQQTGSRNTVVAGNKIGTDITGMAAIPNGTGSSPRAGIVLGGYGNRIGTNSDGVSDELEGNLISGNANVAVYAIYFNNLPKPGAPPAIIAGNWLGVNATGLAPLPNNYGIGGTSYAPTIIRDNVISGHTIEGISTHSSNMLIIGNRIGVGADGVTPLGNGQNGLFLSGNDNVIGGTGPGEGNIIAHNGTISPFYSGVRLGNTGLGNTIRGNRIYTNSQLGIDLRWPDGVNLNDPGDADTGGNNLQNFPVIAFAQAYNNGTTRIQGTLNSHPNTQFTLDFYYNTSPDSTGHGEGEFYLGEAQVMTDASSNAVFDVFLPVTLPPNQFVTATATHPDGSTSEFSLAYAAGGVVDVPLAGLTATHSGLGFVSNAITFSASVTNGTGVTFTWSFGDGQQATGAQVEHFYVQPGEYTVTVQASNNISSANLQWVVSVIVPANINGVVWDDQDADGILGIGEAGDANALVTVSGPGFLLSTNVDAQGRFAVFTGDAGSYEVSVTVSNRIATTPNPVVVLMSTNGGTMVNFGMHESPTNGHGFITGRAWIDLDGSGFPEPDEEPLAGLELWFYGYQYPAQTVTTDINGLFSLTLPHERIYFLRLSAPGYYPDQREIWQWLDADEPLLNVHFPFARGGTVSGRVRDFSGAGVPNAHLNIGQPINVTSTDANGDYVFIEQEPRESKGLGMLPPYPYVNYNGDGFRVFPLPPNSTVFQDWLVERRGRLTIRAEQTVGGQTLPVGNSFFRLQGSGVDQLMATGLNGQTWADLNAGTYTITALPEYLPTNAIISPSSRIVSISNQTFAETTFSVNPAQSISVVCEALATGFPATVEIHNSEGLVETRAVAPPAATTVFTTLQPGTYEVRILPASGLEGWPIHTNVVAINSGTHAVVNYPYNPANLQSLYGYAFQDVCVPLGLRGNGVNCNETGVPGNNGLTVTLYNASGTVVTNTETALGTSWNYGFYRFDDLPVGEYRVVITLPPGYTPTTSTNVLRSLDGIATPEQIHFGYQRTETPTLTGRVYVDADGNGSYEPTWDDVLSGTPISIRTLSDTLIASMNTASDGSYTLVGIAPGEYRITMTRPDVQLTNTAQIPVVSSITTVDFPLAPPGTTPRVLIFADANTNGLADPGEQRFGGVTVQFVQGPCDELGTVLQTVVTSSDGLAIFTAPPTGDEPLCARITQGLPPNTIPMHLPGVVVPRGSGSPVPVPIVPSLEEPPLEVTDSIALRDDTFSLIFRSASDRTYTVERTVDLNNWSTVSNAMTYDFGYSRRVVIPLHTNVHQSLFRILEQR